MVVATQTEPTLILEPQAEAAPLITPDGHGLTIVIPAFNEAGSVGATVAALRGFKPAAEILAPLDADRQEVMRTRLARRKARFERRDPIAFLDAAGTIGPPGQRFDAVLSRAIQRMLDTPVPEGELEVVATPGVNYTYAAPELEQLGAAQKHLLRMGPTNARAIQAKLRELHKALGLPPAGR